MLCSEYPGKYPAPSAYYFGDIDFIFNASKDAEIDLSVLRVKGEIEKEDFDRRQREREQKQKAAQTQVYQNPFRQRSHEDDAW